MLFPLTKGCEFDKVSGRGWTSVAPKAEVCGRFLWGSDTSNKPFEWTGHRHCPASVQKSLPATQGKRSKVRKPPMQSSKQWSANPS